MTSYNPDYVPKPQLSAKDFSDKLNSKLYDWEFTAQLWLHEIFPDFSEFKTEYRAPDQVRTSNDLEIFCRVLGSYGFSAKKAKEDTLQDLFDLSASPYTISLSIPPQRK